MAEFQCTRCGCVEKSSWSDGPWWVNDGMCDECGPCGNCGKEPKEPRAIRLGQSKLLKARIIPGTCNTVSGFTRGIPFDCDCIQTFFDSEDELRNDLFNVLTSADSTNHANEVEQVCASYATYIDYPKILIHLKGELEDYIENLDEDVDVNDFENGVPFLELMRSKYPSIPG